VYNNKYFTSDSDSCFNFSHRHLCTIIPVFAFIMNLPIIILSMASIVLSTACGHAVGICQRLRYILNYLNKLKPFIWPISYPSANKSDKDEIMDIYSIFISLIFLLFLVIKGIEIFKFFHRFYFSRFFSIRAKLKKFDQDKSLCTLVSSHFNTFRAICITDATR